MQINNRCHAITIKGTRCTLKSSGDNNFLCYRHKKIHDDGRKIKMFDDVDVGVDIDVRAATADAAADADADETLAKYKKKKGKNKIDYSQFLTDYMDDDDVSIYLTNSNSNNNNNSNNNSYVKPAKKSAKQIQQIKQIQPIRQIQPIKQIQKIDDILIPLDPAQNYECQCCFSELPFEQLIKCSSASTKFKHIFCTDCIKGYIEAGINDKKVSCQCMSDTKDEHCNGFYLESDIEKCLDEQLLKNFKEMLVVSTVTSFAKILDGYQICPHCNMYGLIIEGNVKYVKCDRCVDKSWCILCRRDAHDKDPCWKIKNEKDYDAIVYAVTETLTNALVHKCPSCHSKYIKEEGCNLMTCSSCKSYSCYLCGLLIKPKKEDKYWHFYGEGGTPTAIKTCKLFNDTGNIIKTANQGNTKFNNDKVIAECKKLLNANTVEVQNIMINEMKKQGVDIGKEIFVAKLPIPIPQHHPTGPTVATVAKPQHHPTGKQQQQQQQFNICTIC